MIDSLVGGRAAAGMMDMARADHVWRAIAKHGKAYPGRIVVVEIGRAKAVRRDELAAFASWYVETVRAGSPRWGEGFIERRDAAKSKPVKSPKLVKPSKPVKSAVGEQESARRRAALREAIARIEQRTGRLTR